MKMAIKPKSGNAILIGLNELGQTHYGNSCPRSSSAEFDIEDYALIAKLNGFNVQSYLGESATRNNVLTALKRSSKAMNAGDFLILAFAGFGGVIANFGSPSNGVISPTWCLQNGQLLVSEVHQLLSDFPAGANILVIADTSSVLTGLKFQPFQAVQFSDRQRSLQLEIAETVYLQNKDFYDAIYLGTKKNPEIQANVIWLSACQINQMSFETNYNGYLTAAIKHVWNGAAFKGDFEQYLNEIILSMPIYQSPLLTYWGGNAKEMLAKKPFCV